MKKAKANRNKAKDVERKLILQEDKMKREKILSQIGQLFINKEEAVRQVQVIDQEINKLKLQLFKNG